LKAKTIQYDKNIKEFTVVEYTQNLTYDTPIQNQQKCFLMCNSCFWMASTLQHYHHHSSNNHFTISKECPICENKIDRFSIPTDLN